MTTRQAQTAEDLLDEFDELKPRHGYECGCDACDQWERLRELVERVTASEGAQRIAAERMRQLEVEGCTRERDAEEHFMGQLASAAAAYAIHAARQEFGFDDPEQLDDDTPYEWPWDKRWWKPSDDPIRNLEKAGALIAAELDRRLASRADDEGESR